MGRKIKIAFSSNHQDSAFAYFHDFGFIPVLKTNEEGALRGFKVLVAGGLGAQSIVAKTAFEFLPEDQLIPFTEAAIRVFDRYGEREKRHKARLKFLVKKIGLEAFLELVKEEQSALAKQSIFIDTNTDFNAPSSGHIAFNEQIENALEGVEKYQLWKQANVIQQKQEGWYAVRLRVPLGNISSDTARRLAELVRLYAANDIRFTVNQGILLKYVAPQHLPQLFYGLERIGLAEAGFDTTVDITACPGTDTCNLGVTNSTALSTKLSEVIEQEYPDLIVDNTIKIKISGCMNSCGQHMAANIGLHGSSIKKKGLVIPAMQIVLGGGVDESGLGFIAEKVIKLPTKRIPDALRVLLDHYEKEGQDGEYFNDYYYRLGKRFFYNLLKPLADTETLSKTDYFDWGEQKTYEQAIGVGECAGVMYDMVGTIIQDAKDKVALSTEALEQELLPESIYHSYTAFVIGAKALLLSIDVKCNTQIGILNDFETHFIDTNLISFTDFSGYVLALKREQPTIDFATNYFNKASQFVGTVINYRTNQLASEQDDKLVISEHYKA